MCICSVFLAGGQGGKNALASASPFSVFEVASFLIPLGICLGTGIHTFPPFPAGADRYLCAVHKSRSSALLSQSCQCCFLVAGEFCYMLCMLSCAYCVLGERECFLAYMLVCPVCLLCGIML